MTDINNVQFSLPYHLTPMSRKVMGILLRDGGITHLNAMHYGIGSITKEIARIRRAYPSGYRINTIKRKDAEGNTYTRWTLKQVA